MISQPILRYSGMEYGNSSATGLLALTHMLEALMHQPLHDAAAGVFRIGADAGDKADGIDCAVDVHLQRIDRDLRYQIVSVEAAQHVRTLQHRELRLLDLVILPAAFG